MTPAIGWVSSLILLLTIAAQVRKQWVSKSSQGVSKWLFAGQTLASIGFCLYSVLQRDWVFVVTNGIMVLNSLAGGLIMLHHRRRDEAQRMQPALSEFGPITDSPKSA